MTPTRRAERERTEKTSRSLDRRRFLAAGAGIGATLLAGCAGDASMNGDSTGTTVGSTSDSVGQFRLLISDAPADIGDFDSLTVTLSNARAFRSAGDGSSDGEVSTTGTSTTTTATTTTEAATTTSTTTNETTAANETASGTTTTTPATTNETTEQSTSTTEAEGGEAETTSGDDGQRGFFTMDLGGAQVDLTQVIGEKAIGVFDDELPTGRYTKIELHVSDVTGIVGGDEVDVKLPSEKLQITKPFEVTAGESVSFVFDITVVKKGKKAAYNLQPVISESGVAGKDVQMREVEADQGQTDDDTNEDEQTETTTTAGETTSSTTETTSTTTGDRSTTG